MKFYHRNEKELSFEVKRIINGGYTGRDAKAAKKHIDELKAQGISSPDEIPAFYPVTSDNITLPNQIEVLGEKTSGEAEFVILVTNGKLYIAVGSDHTDRELEKHSIWMSKQVCPNVISQQLWDYSSIKDHWDKIRLKSWVKVGGEKKLYQSGTLSELLRVEDLLGKVRDRLNDQSTTNMIIYSGTIPVLFDHLIFSDYFEARLVDEKKGCELACEYTIRSIRRLKTKK